MSNGKAFVNGGLGGTAVRSLHAHSPDHKENDGIHNTKQIKSEANNVNKASDDTDSALERNDSDKNSRANDSGIVVKDSFRSDKEVTTDYNKIGDNDDDVFDSDGSEFPVPARIQEVTVQIEEISKQKQLPSVTSYSRSVCDDDDEAVLFRRK